MKRISLGLLLAPVVAVAVACGGASSTSSEPGIDAGSDGSTPTGDAAPSDAGTDLVPADTTKIVVTEKGGFAIQPPDGSVCSISDTTYTLTLPARELSWKFCEYGDGGPYTFNSGQATISEADFVAVSTALHGLRRTTQVQCGADKPSDQIVFTTPKGDVTYLDDFYFCDPKDTKIYVSGIDAVLSELGKLAH